MGENSWIISVNENVTRLSHIREAEFENWEQHSIYKLPAYVTDPNKNAYKPRAISFGPNHHGEPNLEIKQADKEPALYRFLRRSGKPLEHYVNAVDEVLQNLKDAYEPLDDRWRQNSAAFSELMIRDGCFMIEVLRTSSNNDQNSMADYAYNDPLFSNHGRVRRMPYIKRDMLMLENQLPMLLLKTLLDDSDQESINTIILKFYFPHSPPKRLGECLHVLDVYRRSLLWVENEESRSEISIRGNDEIPSARGLEEAGIRFKKSDSTSLKDIHFDCDRGILSLPQIIVDDKSETIFRNLVAFERSHVDAGNEVTDYIFFMDNIIDNAADVNILQTHEIIRHTLGSDETVAQMFNSLLKDVALDEESSLTAVRVAINCYCKRKWHRWRANLIQTYFRNPWAIISVIAAIVLFAFTIFQAVYAALQYYQGHNSSPAPPPGTG